MDSSPPRPVRPLGRRSARVPPPPKAPRPPTRGARAGRTPAPAALDAVRGAGYHNLQLWRRRRKVLSVWRGAAALSPETALALWRLQLAA
jgi:hypothetical protein